jgi:uncharacterized SAM-binding protein YcdF (DUF218 family)
MTRKGLFLSVLLVASWLSVSRIMARALLISTQPVEAEVAIVLSGAPVYAERIRHALAIYKAHRAKLLVLTDDGTVGGWSRPLQRRPRMIELGTQQLLDAGVPSTSIVQLPGEVHSTYQEAERAAVFIRETRVRSLIIVTSPYHARRALWTFHHTPGFSNVAIAIDPVTLGDLSPNPGTWWLTRRGWSAVAGEYVKFAYYRLAY